jgi:glycosyltransferase involved in cell wall biosynthesis
MINTILSRPLGLGYLTDSKIFGRTERASHPPIVAHCHLSWDNVWQRPQQLLSRLAQRHPVLFVETHVDENAGSARYEYRPAVGADNVTQLKIIIPRSVWHLGEFVDLERRRLVKAALNEPRLRKFKHPIHWFYDPMAVTAFAGHLGERLTVYDCMDQLSQFKGASSEIEIRERTLLALADVVFCGGDKLHKAKSAYNSNAHFYGCGVDIEHFSQALGADTRLPKEVRDLPRPIFGYYGVIDERLDYELIRRLAETTSGSVVLIVPTAKIDPASLPKRPNLHWLGRRAYEELPAYSKSFDVCLMPFALNEATEYINPTKALEYLGAGRPVVSTPIADVVSNFADVVKIGRTATEFLDLCEREAASPNLRRQKAGIRRARANSWEGIVSEMQAHMAAALSRKSAQAEGLSGAMEAVGAV